MHLLYLYQSVLVSPNKEMVQPSLKSGKRIDYVGSQWSPKSNKLDPTISKDEVEFINMMANDMDPSESTLCATRMWLHRLSFILIVMGSMSLLFISFFYLLAFIKHKKVSLVTYFRVNVIHSSLIRSIPVACWPHYSGIDGFC